MFDIGAGELLIIGVVALVVIGPKELPGVLRQVGKATAKMRQMAGEFRAQFDEAMREAELEDAKKHITGLTDSVANLNPVSAITNEIHSSASLLNTPYVPVETASPIAPLDVSALPVVAANDSAPVKAKPVRKRSKPVAAVAEEIATVTQSVEPATEPTPVRKKAATPKAPAVKLPVTRTPVAKTPARKTATVAAAPVNEPIPMPRRAVAAKTSTTTGETKTASAAARSRKTERS